MKMDFSGSVFYSNAILMTYMKLFCALHLKVVSLTLNVKSITNYFIAVVFNAQKQPGKSR